MPYTTLIPPEDLATHIGESHWAIVDCRFALTQPQAGRRQYEESHIPGAVYAHLDDDLSGPIIAGQTGRHPLPAEGEFARRLSEWGIDGGVQVVAYDDGGGGIASRLWWMLRWLGHDHVAVLDGGWQAWRRAGLPTVAGTETRAARRFEPQLRAHLQASVDDVRDIAGGGGSSLLFDARTADRYRGENETLDATAGHIPGAASAPYSQNLGEDGNFLSQEALRERYRELLGGRQAADAIFYCGSGVTAAHDLLALLHAGLGDARLYAGSWSDWITDPSRPVATGPNSR